jgi:hypothetical protein
MSETFKGMEGIDLPTDFTTLTFLTSPQPLIRCLQVIINSRLDLEVPLPTM